jgi:hypothetical protein
VGERPTIVVLHPGVFEIDPPECDFDGMTWRDRAEVYITDTTVELLVALGWTRPPEQPSALDEPLSEKRGSQQHG